jgi:catechol 2,3-dioxygenase-like lactoylglutathione lyase family enzyme
MTIEVEGLVEQFEQRRLTRRELVAALTTLFLAAGSEASAQAPRVVEAQTLNHASLSVSDVERSAEFYQRVLGLEVVSRPGNGGINLGLGSSFLGLYALPDPGRVHHVCLGVDDFDADRVAEALREVGVQASIDRNPRNRTSGGDQLYFSDPDGTLMQLGQNGYQG